MSLHVLPTTYKAINSNAPQYICGRLSNKRHPELQMVESVIIVCVSGNKTFLLCWKIVARWSSQRDALIRRLKPVVVGNWLNDVTLLKERFEVYTVPCSERRDSQL